MLTDDLLSDLDAETLRYAILDAAGYGPAQIGELLHASAEQIRDTELRLGHAAQRLLAGDH
jgi:ParB-like chromosome segregation protein Spo0J